MSTERATYTIPGHLRAGIYRNTGLRFDAYFVCKVNGETLQFTVSRSRLLSEHGMAYWAEPTVALPPMIQSRHAALSDIEGYAENLNAALCLTRWLAVAAQADGPAAVSIQAPTDLDIVRAASEEEAKELALRAGETARVVLYDYRKDRPATPEELREAAERLKAVAEHQPLDVARQAYPGVRFDEPDTPEEFRKAAAQRRQDIADGVADGQATPEGIITTGEAG